MMNSISSLLPAMSSIAMFFQRVVELVSPVQARVHIEPSTKMSPGAGVTGTASARTRKGVAKTRNATKVFVEIISLFVFFLSSRGSSEEAAVGRLCSNENRLIIYIYIYIGFLFFCLKGVCMREGSDNLQSGDETVDAVVCGERERQKSAAVPAYVILNQKRKSPTLKKT